MAITRKGNTDVGAGQDPGSRRAWACAATLALALTLCCAPCANVAAFADESSGAPSADQVDSSSSSAANPSQDAPSSSTTETAPDAQNSTEAVPSSSNASSNPSFTPIQPDLKQEAEAKKDDETSKAEEKLRQAEAIYSLIASTQRDIERLSAEFAEAERAYDEIISSGQEKREQLDQARMELETQKEDLSEFVVEMYKQGGMAPYYEVLLKSTSHREFVSTWRFMNEVSVYGKGAIQGKRDAVAALETEVDALNADAAEAEQAKNEAHAALMRAELTRLAAAPHAAMLRMEAAELLGDEAMRADAQAELDAANAALGGVRSIDLSSVGASDSGGVFAHPCPNAVYSSGFGYRSFDNAFHKGLDMAIAEGTPYFAAASGTVISVTNDGGYNGGAGNWVVIDHGNGLVTKYMHSLATLVNNGDHVERGQVIGLVGNTGNSFGAHLHFQVEINGVAIDPLVYLSAGN